jgi:AcrR family transcriptional regulator
VTPAGTRSARADEVVAEGRRLLEEEGPEALTMRRLADRLGIRAPSLYKHLPGKPALEAAIIATGLEESAAAFEAAVDGAADPLPALAAAYRGFALAHPHLYRLMHDGPLPRQHLPPGLEDRAAAPVLRVTGSRARARALWGVAHGRGRVEVEP